ncbi:DNA-dependent protein kinase catalytic subunit-interacting protein, putative [Ixodes scapularis]|uniref:DNA-dependent protein kinase catalytic subunit-interacting protein, putative n=1 Tax=Ixodes scapularis TaxID=6945 RepID=B7Q5E7_IXOSC|nr:DNA-dependent protein kinase catalytic subunit-interacting protein, putative [Ixodes scapularis]|eukprot:XP_002401872.1 DNA-dependent protein kinase catalytic subunit-interacting protein, putative [Ixodes scapularis]
MYRNHGLKVSLTLTRFFSAFKRFKAISPDQVNSDKEIRLPVRDVEILPEFSSNPFRDRLLRTFSSLKDDRLSFEDFLDLLSVLSEAAPIDVKMEYAFQVFGERGPPI